MVSVNLNNLIMKVIKFSSAIIVIMFLISVNKEEIKSGVGKPSGCEAFIYIANNSLFECTLTIDGFNIGNLLVGKSKIYKVELLNDTPKKIKVKVEYLDPDYIEPKSYFLVTKNKLECGVTDSLYIAHTK